jgi:hypothetical protein
MRSLSEHKILFKEEIQGRNPVRESAGRQEKARGHAGNVGSLFTSSYAYCCSDGHCIASSIAGIIDIAWWPTIIRAAHLVTYKKTLWRESVSELHRPRDRSLSVKSVPTFADRRCHVVSMMDTYRSILGFLDRSRYFFFQVAPQLYSWGWVDPDVALYITYIRSVRTSQETEYISVV